MTKVKVRNFVAWALVVLVGVLLWTFIMRSNTSAEEGVVRFAAVGDFGATSNTTAVLEDQVNEAVDFTLALGDYTYGDLSESDWCNFVTNTTGSLPFELTMGNHDTQSGGDHGDIRLLTQCLPDSMSSTGDYGVRYAFTAGNARIINTAIDIPFEGSNNTYWPDPPTTEFTWLDGQIQAAKAAGQWVIVMTHKNCITHADGFPFCEINKKLFNYLLTQEVDLILQGHTHGYGRSKQLKLNNTTCVSFSVAYDANCHRSASSTSNNTVYNSGSGSIVVINGTGGKNLLPYDPNRQELPYFAKKWASNLNPKYGNTIVRIEANQLTVKYRSTADVQEDWFVINR